MTDWWKTQATEGFCEDCGEGVNTKRLKGAPQKGDGVRIAKEHNKKPGHRVFYRITTEVVSFNPSA